MVASDKAFEKRYKPKKKKDSPKMKIKKRKKKDAEPKRKKYAQKSAPLEGERDPQKNPDEEYTSVDGSSPAKAKKSLAEAEEAEKKKKPFKDDLYDSLFGEDEDVSEEERKEKKKKEKKTAGVHVGNPKSKDGKDARKKRKYSMA
jgi:hypothetical protein